MNLIQQIPALFLACSLLLTAGTGLAQISPIPEPARTAQTNGTREIENLQDSDSGGLRIEDLASKRVRLSHVSPERCIQVLKIYGFHTGEPGTPVDPEQIPVIIPLPGTTLHNTVPKPGSNLPLTENDPLNELIVFYDPARPDQITRIINTIEQYIDLPARQIIIEAMILEITEKSLNSLGLEWEMLTSSDNLESLALGKLLNSTDLAPTVSLTASDIFGEFSVKLQALVESGQAEILSRPSILTLNNRMAHFNVSQQIPIAEGQLNRYGELTSVKFKDKMAGIVLGVRPRISKDEREVGMQISASVTAIVPNEDVELKNSSGSVLASSPTLSVREVQTYARIANNMPFIIGGLVSRDDIQISQEVPFLGRLPLIGWMFRTETQQNKRREVVIVITPYILPEEETGTQIGEKSITLRTLPKDDDAFDSSGTRLFRPSYRIRSTDVFNLDFLTENLQLKQMQSLADEAVEQNILLKEKYPWRSFADGRIPGEQILVYRQIYEVIERTRLAREIDPGNIIFFGNSRPGEDIIRLQTLNRHLEQTSKALWREDVKDIQNPVIPSTLWEQLGDRAVAITYTEWPQGQAEGAVLNEPIPDISIFDCPDRAAYDQLLWDLNQSAEDGRTRHSILLADPEDLVRLKRAILLRRTAELNATRKSLTLDNFTVGQNLLMPDITPTQTHLLDIEVARHFFYSDQYYMALRQILDRDIEALKEEIPTDPSDSDYSPSAF